MLILRLSSEAAWTRASRPTKGILPLGALGELEDGIGLGSEVEVEVEVGDDVENGFADTGVGFEVERE